MFTVSVCFSQALVGRRLDTSHILVARTAYNLFDCEDLCSRELR